jgi:hypothetical protein
VLAGFGSVLWSGIVSNKHRCHNLPAAGEKHNLLSSGTCQMTDLKISKTGTEVSRIHLAISVVNCNKQSMHGAAAK